MTEAQAKNTSGVTPGSSDPPFPALTSEHLKLKMRLSPLLQIEESLIRKLTTSSHLRGEAVDFPLAPLTNTDNSRKEISVHSRSSWKSAFKKSNGTPLEEGVIDWDE